MSSDRPENLSANEALERLKQGNQRYASDQPIRPNGDAVRRQELTAGQKPFATIIACADSRVAPELVFDQGLGDLFVIRVAGNIADDGALGSLEYASLYLGVNLIVVMGHRSCGAVSAAVENVDVDGSAFDNHIDALVAAIRPAVQQAQSEGSEDLLERSVCENATMVAEQIERSQPVMIELASQGVEVRSAYYDLESGRVAWLSD